MSARLRAATQSLDHRAQRLTALSPDSVLMRGYSITEDAASGKVIRAAAETARGRKVRIRLGRGRLGASVDEVEP